MVGVPGDEVGRRQVTSRGSQIALLSFATALILGALAIELTFPIEV